MVLYRKIIVNACNEFPVFSSISMRGTYTGFWKRVNEERREEMKEQMKIGSMLSAALMILFLCGCTGEEPASEMEDAFIGVLVGSTVFYEDRGDSVEETTLTQYCEEFAEALPATITQTAVVDLEQDEIPEVILQIALGENRNCGVLVLHWENEQVWGYTLYERQMHEIKENGVFLWSGSASSYGMARAVFLQGTYSFQNILWVEESEEKAVYYKEGTEITSEEFERSLSQFHSLEEPQWFNYSAENYDSLFR